MIPRSLALLIGLAVYAHPGHAGMPAPVIPEGFAIQVKQERVTLAQLQEIAALGFAYVRTGIWWDNVELHQRGAMRWDVPIARFAPDPSLPDPMQTSFETFIAQARRAGLKVLVTMYHGNILYTGGQVPVMNTHGKIEHQLAAPRTPEQIAAFANFAAATARHFSGRYGAENFIWSIWNEPNMDTDFPPRHDPAIFGDVLLQSCRAIKQAVPGAPVIGPDITVIQGKGEGEIDYDFIKKMLRHANVLTCIDAFSLHPYRPFPPDTVAADYRRIRKILRPYSRAAGREVPIAVDEWGYTMHSHRRAIDHPEADDPAVEQAALLARFYLVNLAEGVPLATWYEWQDDGDDPKEGEHGFGIVALSGRKKPAHATAKTLIATLRGMKFSRKLAGAGCKRAQAQFYLFAPASSGGRAPILAAWSDRAGAGFTIAVAAVADGQNFTLEKPGGRAAFALGPLPRYITIKDGAALDIACSAP